MIFIDTSQELIDAADDCDFQKVKECIKEGVDVNAYDVSGRTALHFAAMHGCTEIAKLLIDAKANVNAKDGSGVTPLYLAAHSEIVELLIAAKADPVISPKNDLKEENKIIEAVINRKDKDGYTLIMWALEDNNFCPNIELIKFFIDKGADLSVTYPDGQTLIEKAVRGGDTRLIKLLFEACEKVHNIAVGKLPNDCEALIIAVQEGNMVAVSNALKAGADINTKDKIGCTPLMHAVCRGYFEITDFLIEAGADISMKTDEGDTALYLASVMEYEQIVSLIEQAYIEKYNNK